MRVRWLIHRCELLLADYIGGTLGENPCHSRRLCSTSMRSPAGCPGALRTPQRKSHEVAVATGYHEGRDYQELNGVKINQFRAGIPSRGSREKLSSIGRSSSLR